jgi:2-keto-4-pentenoate hydratase/2-oxohepta-3-ene-1,7-dioic acid hydratase in catechol pathway
MLKEKGVPNPRRRANAVIPPDMVGFLEGGNESMKALHELLKTINIKEDPRGLDGERLALSLNEVRLMPPIPKPGKVYCVAVNFYDHATELIENLADRGKEVERLKNLNLDIPVVFQKPPTIVIGPTEPIIKPHASKNLDYECEFAVVIGREGKYIKAEDAYDYVAGYTILIDVSFRDHQRFPSDIDFRMFKHNINWTKGKGMDNAAPLGPCLLTKDEILDPYDPPVKLITRVNGVTRQDGDFSTMIIKIPRLIEYISEGTTLKPGDIIATGTVGGVARSWSDGYLKVGDIVECEIPQIGVLRHIVIADPFNT